MEGRSGGLGDAVVRVERAVGALVFLGEVVLEVVVEVAVGLAFRTSRGAFSPPCWRLLAGSDGGVEAGGDVE